MKPGRGVWLTTIGDLLTLLLCFVLTTMFSANVNRQVKSKQKQDVTQQNSLNSESADANGRQFASNLVTEKQHPLWILRFSDFRVGFNGLSEDGVVKIRDLERSKSSKFELQICKSGLNNAESIYKNVSDELKAEVLNFVVGVEACQSTVKDDDRQADKEVVMIKAL